MKGLSTKAVRLCSTNFLYNLLQSNRENCLVFDLRTMAQIETGTIINAIKITTLREIRIDAKTEKLDGPSPLISKCDLLDLIEQPVPESTLKKIKQRKRYFCFLLISDDTVLSTKLHRDDDFTENGIITLSDNDEWILQKKEQLSELDSMSIVGGMELYDMLKEENMRELYILNDGVKDFLNTYPFMLHTKESTEKAEPPRYPNEIVKRVFLGNLNQVKNKDILENLQITHILNTAGEVELDEGRLETYGITYYKLPIGDYVDFNISQFFEQAYETITKALEVSNSNIIIHCALGRSRSVAIMIMYLMRKLGWSFEKAHDYVLARNTSINVNIGFKELLEKFEKNNFQFVE